MQSFAKFTWPFMKQIVNISEKEYCYHVSVTDYALYTGKGKAVVKRTSEVSKIVGVSKRTIQFYDDEGMIKVERSKTNYRLYDESVLEKLWEIMIYKEMGLKLEAIKQLFRMPENEKKRFCKAHIRKIEEEISALEDQKRFCSLIMAQGLPQIPDEGSDITYKSRAAELRKNVNCKGKSKQLVLKEKITDKKYYAENIKELRYLLDEAYQQMQQGQFRYAIYDADSVMRQAIKIMLQYKNGGYVLDDLLMNMKICERKMVFGTDKDFISRLYEVYHICKCAGQEFNKGEYLNHRKVHFVIMQLKDLLNFVEGEIIYS